MKSSDSWMDKAYKTAGILVLSMALVWCGVSTRVWAEEPGVAVESGEDIDVANEERALPTQEEGTGSQGDEDSGDEDSTGDATDPAEDITAQSVNDKPANSNATTEPGGDDLIASGEWGTCYWSIDGKALPSMLQ